MYFFACHASHTEKSLKMQTLIIFSSRWFNTISVVSKCFKCFLHMPCFVLYNNMHVAVSNLPVFPFISLLLPQWILPCENHKSVHLHLSVFELHRFESILETVRFSETCCSSVKSLLKSLKCWNFNTNSVLHWHCTLWILPFLFVFISLWNPIKCCYHTKNTFFCHSSLYLSLICVYS